MENLFVVGVAQAVFFCYLLLTKKGNVLANRLLTFFLLMIGFSLLLQYLYVTNTIEKFPHLIGLDTTFPLIYAPLIFFYTKFLTFERTRFYTKDFLHLIPFIIFLFYVLFNFYLKNGVYKYEYLQDLFQGNVPLDLSIVDYFKIAQAAVYIILTLRVIISHQNRIRTVFSNIDKKALTWLKILTLSIAGVYFIQFIVLLLISFNIKQYLQEVSLFANSSEVLFVYILAFFGIRQPQIYKPDKQLNDAEPEKSIPIAEIIETPKIDKGKYAGSALTAIEKEEIYKKLITFMDDEKPHLESQVTINQIATQLDISTKYLSQVINEKFEQNFFNFINQYRIEEVKKKLKDEKYQHLSILGIALECGFNSKSSFNSVFKKLTGQTPSSYLSATS